ncbi:MAG: phosphoglycerate kinase [Gammaproteobacteria bacterium GWE2_42_36]|nr:MAG: phosphoglycerate kinase [Gammaproteobacteria bacterium GWE2_42_36]HCU05072.1 phosphoglycerate kinase [Coxiellaceae bacterium]
MTEVNLANKRVLIREDLNVPVKEGKIKSEARIVAALPTIKKALAEKAAVIIISHLGRPTPGKYDEENSLAPVAKRLSELLGQPVPLVKDWIDGGFEVKPGEVVLCENVRCLVGEKENDDALSQKMAKLCDIYIHDAFATAHRKEASTYGVAKYAKVACAGLLLDAELEALGSIMERPTRPLMAVVGGSKVSTKLKLLGSITKMVDVLFVGGGIANTFLAAAGKPVGKSLYEPDLVEEAKRLMIVAKAAGKSIPLPIDVVVAKEFSEAAVSAVKKVDDVAADDMILDLGPETAKLFAAQLQNAKTILWNGPVGAFEMDQFAKGTDVVGKGIANSSAYSVAGGGDTIAAIEKCGIKENISYISTAGGAFLEYLEGDKLPAVEVLEACFAKEKK